MADTLTLPPMRGIKQALEEIKAKDPYTAITEKALRRLVLTGELPTVKIGRKYLINMDILNAYLSGNTMSQTAVKNNYGAIRSIAE